MNDTLRIGDADRETAARELGEHFALGRLTPDEHAERLEQIWAARTAADLKPAFRDLPRPRAAGPGPSAPPRRTSGWRPRMPYLPFPFRALVAIIAIWWGFHHLLFFLVALAVYVVFLRRFVRHRRRRGPWGPRGHYEAGWR